MSSTKKDIVFLVTIITEGLVLLIVILLIIKYFYDRCMETFSSLPPNSQTTVREAYDQLYAELGRTVTSQLITPSAPGTSQMQITQASTISLTSSDNIPPYEIAIELPTSEANNQIGKTRAKYVKQLSKPPSYEEYISNISFDPQRQSLLSEHNVNV